MRDLLARIPDRSARKAFALVNALPPALLGWAAARAAAVESLEDWESLRAAIRERHPELPPIAVNGLGCAVVALVLSLRPVPDSLPKPRMDASDRRFLHAVRKEALLSDFGEELREYLG